MVDYEVVVTGPSRERAREALECSCYGEDVAPLVGNAEDSQSLWTVVVRADDERAACAQVDAELQGAFGVGPARLARGGC